MTPSGRFVGKFWSIVLAAVALNRSASYFERPPTGGAGPVIEGWIPYAFWALLLFLGAFVLIVGVVLDIKPIKLVAHIFLTLCYAVFVVSIVASAIFNGTGWSGSGTAAVTALLHAERISVLMRSMFGGREHD